MSDAVRTVIQDAVRDLTGIELTEDDLSRPLDELGLDSIVLVDVVCELEEALGVEFDIERLETLIDCRSLDAIVQALGSTVP